MVVIWEYAFVKTVDCSSVVTDGVQAPRQAGYFRRRVMFMFATLRCLLRHALEQGMEAVSDYSSTMGTLTCYVLAHTQMRSRLQRHPDLS